MEAENRSLTQNSIYLSVWIYVPPDFVKNLLIAYDIDCF